MFVPIYLSIVSLLQNGFIDTVIFVFISFCYNYFNYLLLILLNNKHTYYFQF